MFQYVLRRLVVAVPMLLGAMSIVFFAMRILPGDPCVAMMGDQATTSALADCTRNLGLHRPLAVQYVDYLWRSVQFDFGRSLRQGYPVSEYIARMFPHTFVLVMASAVVAALVGIPIGIVSALKRRNPLIDYPLPPGKHRIRLIADGRSEELEVEVVDTGSGTSPIFFMRASSTSSRSSRCEPPMISPMPGARMSIAATVFPSSLLRM